MNPIASFVEKITEQYPKVELFVKSLTGNLPPENGGKPVEVITETAPKLGELVENAHLQIEDLKHEVIKENIPFVVAKSHNDTINHEPVSESNVYTKKEEVILGERLENKELSEIKEEIILPEQITQAPSHRKPERNEFVSDSIKTVREIANEIKEESEEVDNEDSSEDLLHTSLLKNDNEVVFEDQHLSQDVVALDSAQTKDVRNKKPKKKIGKKEAKRIKKAELKKKRKAEKAERKKQREIKKLEKKNKNKKL